MHSQYFTPYEVAQHNSPSDCWLSVFHRVYDLTELIKKSQGADVKTIIENAGRDVSYWFDATTEDVRTCICPSSGRRVPYCPQGRILHVPPPYPCSNYDTSVETPWWSDPKYQVGKLTKSTRVIRLKNVLTGQDDKLEVPEEESLREIRERYFALNHHATSYAIKAFIKDPEQDWVLKDMALDLNLTDNGIPDETQRFERCSLAPNTYTPVLLFYWMDELTSL